MDGDERATAGPPVPTEAGRSAWRTVARRVLPPLFSVAIVVAVFWYFLPQFTSMSAVWVSIRSMTWLQILILALLALWNQVTYFIVNVSTMPGLTYPQAAVATESSTAVSNTVPGGGAIGIAMNFAMFGSWGFSASRITVSLLVSGVWNNFAKLALPVVALVLVVLQGSPSGGRLAAGVLGLVALVAAIVLLGMLLSSEQAAARLGRTAARMVSAVLRVFRRPPARGWDRATVKFRYRTIRLLSARWPWITAATLLSHLSLYLVLLVALRFLGVSDAEVGWAEVLAVFAFARLLTAIPFTPGGLGVIELALITGLSAAGGPRADVAAAVLVFRALTYVLPIPLGAVAYVVWRRNRSWRRPPGGAPRTDLVAEWVEPGSGAPAVEEARPARDSAARAADAGAAEG
jgi:putative heme transporter